MFSVNSQCQQKWYLVELNFAFNANKGEREFPAFSEHNVAQNNLLVLFFDPILQQRIPVIILCDSCGTESQIGVSGFDRDMVGTGGGFEYNLC